MDDQIIEDYNDSGATTIAPEVLLTIKCFKQIEYQGFARIGLDNLETEKATIQVDNRIIPRNK